MALVKKLDSNISSTRLSVETAFKIADGAAVWMPLEINSYGDAAAKFTKVARSPIDSDRQRKKGVTTDLDATFSATSDFTSYNLQQFLPGMFYADYRSKTELGGAGQIVSVNASNQFTAAGGLTVFPVGALIVLRGGTQSAGNSNRILRVTVSTATLLTVNETITAETLPSTAKLVQVGVRTAAGDLDVDASGVLPKLTSTTLNFVTLGINNGEFVWIGGDAALTFFSVNAVNNCLARVLNVTATALTLDKCSKGDMITEANTLNTVELYVGRFLKNEQIALIKRRTYQVERQLGASDDALPTQIQSEYFTGGIINEMTLNYAQAAIMTFDLKLVCADQELRTGATGVKAGTRPAVENADAHNTSSDLKRVRLAKVVNGDEDPTPLFAFIPSLTLNFTNNVEPLKALTVLGSFEASAGDFVVTGSCEGYFNDIATISAIRNNDTCTLDIYSYKNGQGIVVDLPLVTLGDGSIKLEKDKSQMVPLTLECASGEEVNANLDFTCGITQFDGLPLLAALP